MIIYMVWWLVEWFAALERWLSKWSEILTGISYWYWYIENKFYVASSR